MLLLGSHVSFNKNKQLLGSVEEALSYSSNTFMFYTGAPQNTVRSELNEELTNEAFKVMKESNINLEKVIIHAPYIINLGNPAPSKHAFSIEFLIKELERAETLGIKNIVLHPGAHVGNGVDVGIESIVKGLNEIFDKNKSDVRVLLETMAGKGTEIGRNTLELKRIIDQIKDQHRIGVCLDTCHLNDSGVSIEEFDNYIKDFDDKIGIDKIKCIHVNDSKNELGAGKDRHENIGIGTIGFDNLLYVIYHEKFTNIPKILETPWVEKTHPPYKQEIQMIKNKKYNNNLIEDIINNK